MIEKFEIQGQSNKYHALRSCFSHYQETEDHQDENYSHIIHLLLQIADEPLLNGNGKTYRDLSSIIQQIENNDMNNKQNERLSIAFMSKLSASQQLSEVIYFCIFCEYLSL